VADKSPDEPLEAFYADEADDVVERLAEPGDDDSEQPGGAQTDFSAGLAAGSSTGLAAGSSAGAGAGRRKTVTGALMAGIAMGLREAFEPTYHDRTAIEQPAPEQPLEPQKYEVHLDPVAPESSFAIYRPWVDDGSDDPDHPGRSKSDDRRDRKGGGAGALGG